MPEPRKGEGRDDFMSRCMADDESRRTFPDQAQRAAFCGKTYDEAKGSTPRLRIEGACGPLELLGEREQGGKRLRPFSMVAYTGAAMNLEGFYRPVVVDLAGLSVPSPRLPILRQHDLERIVGHTEEIEISEGRLRIAGVMSGVGEASREVLQLADNGFPWGASVGASIESREFVDAGQKVTVNGREVQGPLIVARKTTLRETSFVALGADPGTSATVAASTGVHTMKLNEWVAAKGFEPDKLSDVQRATLEAAWKAETVPPPPAPVPRPAPAGDLDDVLTAARAGQERRAKIAEIVAGVITEQPELIETAEALARQAVEAGWDVDRFELEILRHRRPQGAHLHLPRESPLGDEVVEAAVCMAGGLKDVEGQFDERTLTLARKKWKHGLGLSELVLTAAEKNGGHRGYSLRSNLQAVLKAAFTPAVGIRAGALGPSTYSLPNILSNVANKFTAMGFNAVDSAWRQIAKIRSVNDFKTITSLTLTGSMVYELVPPSGELKHGDVGERAYTNKADTYGRLLGIDRRDLINDDLGALTDAGMRMGRGGALALNKQFWTIFLNNGTFFTAGNNNVSSGDFSLASLATADEVFRRQTDPDGQPLGIFPAILLVPPALRIEALNAMNSGLVVGSTGPTPAANSLAGAYTPVSSPYMQNASFTGNSATAFYLLADPGELAAIEVCFLNGVESPTVETADLEFNMLGIALRGFHDFGCALQEFRAGVRSTGV